MSGSGFTQTVALPLTIATPSTFTLSAGQSGLTVKLGATGQLSVISAHVGNFNSAVNVSLTGLPLGVTASLSRSVVSAPGDGTVVASFVVAASAKPGTYNVTMTAVGAGETKTVPLSLTIAAIQDFSFALDVSSMTIQQGAGSTVIVSTGNFTGGFNSTITVTFSGLPVGMNWASLGGTTGNNLSM